MPLMLERVSYDHGIHLRGTPLWFDSDKKRELCVATSLALGLPPKHARLIVSSEMADALAKVGFAGSVLPAPWDRWEGLGGQEVQLVPAPARPGACGALVAMGRDRVLVTGLLRKEVTRWPHADLLVATTPALGGRGGKLEGVLKGLGMFLDQAAADKVRAVVMVGSVEAALDLHDALQKSGRNLKPTGLVGKLIDKTSAPASGLSLGIWDCRPGPQSRLAWVDCGLMGFRQARLQGRPPDLTLPWRYYADWISLKHAVTVSGARQVVLIGASSQSLSLAAHRLGGQVEVRALAPARQLLLG
jgi:hypothetical protein